MKKLIESQDRQLLLLLLAVAQLACNSLPLTSAQAESLQWKFCPLPHASSVRDC